MGTVYLGLGSNIGDRAAHLQAALAGLLSFLALEGISSVYETQPVGFAEQRDFYNLAVRARTNLAPEALLRETQGIERRMGRDRPFRYSPRIIDIDLLLYDDLRLSTPDLTIPHPRMLERAFVLQPLVELDPELRHPGTGERLADRLSAGGLERILPLFPGTRLVSAAQPPD